MFSPTDTRSRHTAFAAQAGLLSACFTGSDWGAWITANRGSEEEPRRSKRRPRLTALLASVSGWWTQTCQGLAERRGAKAAAATLSRLANWQLQDIGVTRYDIEGLAQGRLSPTAFEARRIEHSARRYVTRIEQPAGDATQFDWPKAA